MLRKSAVAIAAAGAVALGGCVSNPFAPGAPTLAQDYASWKASVASASAQLKQLGAAVGADISSVNIAAVNEACALYPGADAIFQDVVFVPGQKLFSSSDIANESHAVASLRSLCAGAPYSSMSASLANFAATFNVVLPLFVKAASPSARTAATVATVAK